MAFIIYNQTNHKYVASPSLEKSFVRYANNTRRFDTEAAAQAECCGDEKVLLFTATDFPWSCPKGNQS